MENIVLYVGGNLVVGKTPFNEVEAKFKKMGFDRVFSNEGSLEEEAKLLREDIAAKASL